MSDNEQKINELLRRYVSGAITAPEEAELERLARKDEALREAMRGLQSAPEADHRARVERMKMRARTRVRGELEGKESKPAVVRPLRRYRYYAAAAVALLLATAVFLLPEFQREATAPTVAIKEVAPADAAAEVEAAAPSPEPMLEAETEAKTLPAPENAPQRGTGRRPDEGTLNPRPAAQKPVASAPTKQGANPTPASPPPPPPATAPAPELSETADAMVEESEPISEPTASPPAAIPTEPTPTVSSREKDVLAAAKAREEARRESAQRRRAESPPEADAFMGQAEASFITGRVTTENGDPIFGALVRQPGLPIGIRTDSNGVFRMRADATATLLDISHPDYTEERVDVKRLGEDLQITLEQEEKMDYAEWKKSWEATKIPLSKPPGYALPEEGYNALRKRIEDNKPADVPAGKIKFSFLVDPDGTLSDFVFRGRPDQATMDYIGETIVNTSIWNVVKGEEPVRVYFKVVFE